MHLKLQVPSFPYLLPIKTTRFDRTDPCSDRKRKPIFRRAMANFLSEKLKLVSKLKTVRWVTFILGIFNLGVVFIGGFLVFTIFPGCSGGVVLPVLVVVVVSGIRIIVIVGAGFAQEATAKTILSQPFESAVVDAVIRHERRMRYKRWLWWTRFGMIVTILQFVGATYLMFVTLKLISYDGGGESRGCFLGRDTSTKGWDRSLVVLFLTLVWLLAIVQCLTGTDVLRWRSFYATHDSAWKAHYQEVFDHGIREALCCLGRVKYLSVLEEDEIYSVARLLGDLVAYRASGTGHLELLTGLALLQRHKQLMNSNEQIMEAPESRIQEAATFHPFAEAAYTGPLLDFGRNPVLFPCAWLHRQGVLTPWARNRRPVLEGDNWWRGHSAAFLKYVNLSPEALRRGRVSQVKREAAYFIVVLHHLRTVVIAVRGTETPEDLITDGLCRECTLSNEDLDGLINSDHLAPGVRRSVLSSFPHYGHSGIVEAARELFAQIDGEPIVSSQELATSDGFLGGHSSKTTGFLSSLLGDGCECQGYNLRIVGHSLGGAIGALLGIMLYRRYPNLHVFSYGSLPCVDSIVGEACSAFVTSIIYNDEFSSRLSVNSILRLRAAAIAALSQDSSADSAMICRLARRILLANKYQQESQQNQRIEENDHRRKPYMHAVKGDENCNHATVTVLEPHSISAARGPALFPGGVDELGQQPYFNVSDPSEGIDDYNIEKFYDTTNSLTSCRDHISQLMGDLPSSAEGSTGNHSEIYLPGLLIHIVAEQRDLFPIWKKWKVRDKERSYRAYLANRENFKDIIVSPYMFLDHLPWRCHYAMQRVLQTRKAQGQPNMDVLHGSYIV